MLQNWKLLCPGENRLEWGRSRTTDDACGQTCLENPCVTNAMAQMFGNDSPWDDEEIPEVAGPEALLPPRRFWQQEVKRSEGDFDLLGIGLKTCACAFAVEALKSL